MYQPRHDLIRTLDHVVLFCAQESVRKMTISGRLCLSVQEFSSLFPPLCVKSHKELRATSVPAKHINCQSPALERKITDSNFLESDLYKSIWFTKRLINSYSHLQAYIQVGTFSWVQEAVKQIPEKKGLFSAKNAILYRVVFFYWFQKVSFSVLGLKETGLPNNTVYTTYIYINTRGYQFLSTPTRRNYF